jgi:uncharacterized protein (TIGR02145 family)
MSHCYSTDSGTTPTVIKTKFIMYTKKLLSVCAAAIIAAATTFAQTATTDLGVVINGVKWATRNVDAPGTFAETPQATGMFYQWNRNIGWSATDPLVSTDGSAWDATNPTGTTWEAANDPSPAGWRVPTLDEFQTLLDAEKVSSEWTTQEGVNGRLYTDNTTTATLFLPAAGARHELDGWVNYVNWQGLYWSSTQDIAAGAYSVYVYNGGAASQSGDGTWGFSVRPVSTGTSGIADVQASKRLQIFPNPAKDFVTIDGIQAGETVTITDLQGRVIENNVQLTENHSINVSALPQGVYLVRVGNKTTKLIINN